MLYQTVVCRGDSLTYGSRATMGYPEYLARWMRERTGLEWLCLNRGMRHATVRDLLHDRGWADPEMVAVLLWIGVNDFRFDRQTPYETMVALYDQLFLQCRRYSVPLLVGTVPRVLTDRAHLPYWRGMSIQTWEAVNRFLRSQESGRDGITVVELSGIPAEFYVDSVHLSDRGYAWVAERFGEALLGL